MLFVNIILGILTLLPISSFYQDRSRTHFQRGDACSLPLDLDQFGCVVAANLLCRLHSPSQFLDRLPSLVAPGGILMLTTPCTWLLQFTPKVSPAQRVKVKRKDTAMFVSQS